jgi:hypothetical protein
MNLSGQVLIVLQGTPQQLTTAEPDDAAGMGKVVMVQAMSGNTGRLAVGAGAAANVKAASDGSQKGIQLDAGESLQVRIRLAQTLWVDGTHTGDGLTYLVTPA